MQPFDGSRYVLKRQLLKIIGRGFGIYDSAGQLVLQADEKPFQLTEELHLYGGLGMREHLMAIHARSVFREFCAYDVLDMQTGRKIGAFGRHGFRSMVRDEWSLLDDMDRPVGKVLEDHVGLALLRRLAVPFIPQNYDLIVGGQQIVDLKQNFNPFTFHLEIEFKTAPAHFDRRLGLAAAVLLAAVEGRQGDRDSNLFRELRV